MAHWKASCQPLAFSTWHSETPLGFPVPAPLFRKNSASPHLSSLSWVLLWSSATVEAERGAEARRCLGRAEQTLFSYNGRSDSWRSCEIGAFKPGQMVINLNRLHWHWEGPIFNYTASKECRAAGGRLTSWTELNFSYKLPSVHRQLESSLTGLPLGSVLQQNTSRFRQALEGCALDWPGPFPALFSLRLQRILVESQLVTAPSSDFSLLADYFGHFLVAMFREREERITFQLKQTNKKTKQISHTWTLFKTLLIPRFLNFTVLRGESSPESVWGCLESSDLGC